MVNGLYYSLLFEPLLGKGLQKIKDFGANASIIEAKGYAYLNM